MTEFTVNLLKKADAQIASIRAELDAATQELKASEDRLEVAISEFKNLSAAAIAIVDQKKSLPGGYESREEANRLGQELFVLIGETFVCDRSYLSLDYCLSYGYGSKSGYQKPIRNESPLGKIVISIYRLRSEINDIKSRIAELRRVTENWQAVAEAIRSDRVEVVLHHNGVEKEFGFYGLGEAGEALFGRNFVNGFGSYLKIRGEYGVLDIARDNLLTAIKAESQQAPAVA